jgi:lipoprotein-anchoring transpeptidase ErfK/SrfK
LRTLNPAATWTAEEVIRVPAVEPFVIPAKGEKGEQTTHSAVEIVISGASHSLSVREPGGKVLMYAPVTVGSEKDPLPQGEWKVLSVSWNPVFNYNPDLFWDADPAHAKARIPSGPNNPVGIVWIDINKEHFGLHGTPEPSTIGRTESHGCVRLTNWDAATLGRMVSPGTRVVIQ